MAGQRVWPVAVTVWWGESVWRSLVACCGLPVCGVPSLPALSDSTRKAGLIVKCVTNVASRIVPRVGSVADVDGARTGTCPTCLATDVPLSVKGYIRTHEAAVQEPGTSCAVTMGSKVVPADGSVAGVEGKQTGTCPVCETPGVQLAVAGGYVRAHIVSAEAIPVNNPQPATLLRDGVRRDKTTGRVLKVVAGGLKEPQTDVSDTGVRTGDPRAAELRRRVEVESVAGTGTVQVPRKVKSEGKPLKSGAPRMVTKMVDVPATEEHVREALAYWQAKTVRYDKDGTPVSESARQHKLAMIEEMFRRLKAMSSEAPVMIVDGQQRDVAAGYRGPTLVRGRAMDADTVAAPRERKDGKPVRGVCEGALGRERADRRIITVPEPVAPKPVLTAGQKRRARRKRAQNAYQQRMAAATGSK